MPQRTALLWDLDGTLVDSRTDIAAAANVARASLGLEALPVDQVAGYVGHGMARLLQRCCPDADEAGMAQAGAAFEAHYAAHCADQTRAYPGIPSLLARLGSDGWLQAVVTNKPVDFALTILTKIDLLSVLTVVIGGDGSRKPDPQPLLMACDRLRVEAGAAIMIGDHHTDLQAAAALGIPAIHCSWGIGHTGDCEPAAVAARPDQITELIRSL